MNAIVRILKEFVYGGFERFGKYYSVYRGFVQDNDDPKSLNRLKLIIPHITLGEVHDYWAFPKNNWSGLNHGVQLIPKKNEMVWVEFEFGNPDHPVWSHGHFGLNEKPTFDERFKDVNTYWICSPNGNYAIINDTKNEISIKTKDGNYIQINEGGISLVLDGNKEISLGTLNHSAHPALLGDLTQEILNLLNEWNNKLEFALEADIKLSQASSSPFLMYVNLLKQIPLLKQKVIETRTKIKKILSDKVTLD